MILKINDRIRNRRLDFFSDLEMTLKYDSVASTFSWKFPFNPENQEHIDLACIGHYHTCTIEHNNELVMTGQIISQHFHDEALPGTVTMSGYSLPGVIEDCEIPTSAYPLQTDLLSLNEIVTKYLKPFSLKFVVDATVATKMSEPYEEANANPGQSLKSYLSELASQKNIVISNDRYGRLVFTQPSSNQKPVFHFKNGEGFYKGMTLSFDGQAMHSRIVILRQGDIDDVNELSTSITNPYVPFVQREKVMVMNSGYKKDILDLDGGGAVVAKNALSQELKNFTLNVRLDRWVVGGKIIRPGDIISVTNPKVYLFKKTNWFVEEVTFRGNSTEEEASLKCVLPCVYDGTVPQYIFKGINLH